ncbi:hypothetical protein RA269_28000 [Pseudomonas syringae pv. tagetis]
MSSVLCWLLVGVFWLGFFCCWWVWVGVGLGGGCLSWLFLLWLCWSDWWRLR